MFEFILEKLFTKTARNKKVTLITKKREIKYISQRKIIKQSNCTTKYTCLTKYFFALKGLNVDGRRNYVNHGHNRKEFLQSADSCRL